MTTNTRISTIATGVTREIVAEQVHLFYDPATKAGAVAFQYRPSLYVNGAFNGPAGDYGVLQLPLAGIAARCFSTALDPMTSTDLSKVSAAGLAQLLKDAFDVLYNEQAAALAATVPAA
jgi:hypothetical protein